MANTSPVTDTAEAAEHLLDVGRATGTAQVVPIGAVSKGLAGEELAELGLMARSAARTRVFSDDGRCVADARLMRRALEYVRAFDGVDRPARPGPAARRSATPAATRVPSRAASACPAGPRSRRRASSRATSAWPS